MYQHNASIGIALAKRQHALLEVMLDQAVHHCIVLYCIVLNLRYVLSCVSSCWCVSVCVCVCACAVASVPTHQRCLGFIAKVCSDLASAHTVL
jgi:hypothetical protein